MLFRIFLSFIVVVLISGLSLITGAKNVCKIGAYLNQNFCQNCVVKQDTQSNQNDLNDITNNNQSNSSQKPSVVEEKTHSETNNNQETKIVTNGNN
jgi:hypothetical protein